MNYTAWYQQHFHELSSQGLWLRGGEINTLALDEFTKRDFRVMFVRLSTYFDTGYSFTHQILYQIAARLPGVYPDLAYLPPRQDAQAFKRDSIPWLLGTQGKNGPEDFDLIGFSNSIVQELINLPTFLARSGILLKKSDRLARADLPILIMGGANAHYSSVAWGQEPLVDGIFVGESDESITRLIQICQQGKKAGRSKAEILDDMQEVAGFFQPEQPRETKKAFIPNLNQGQALEEGPVYFLEDQLGNSHLQISEGCPCFCSFCAESWDRKPYRERRSTKLLELALSMKARMGLDTIDIYSFNFNMHSDLYQILWDLVPHFRRIGLKSQRFDLLAHDPDMVDFQHAIEKASITCGLEGISPRLRRYLHKNLETDQLHASMSAIFNSRARELKIFLIATGLEETQDFVALGDLLQHIKEIRDECRATTRIIFSCTPLVRFPWTPLEFEDGFPIEHYDVVLKNIERTIQEQGFEFRASADLAENWTSQVLVRAAEPEIVNALIEALERTGFIYYRSVSEEFLAAFRNALYRRGLKEPALIGGFSLEESFQKPWAKVDTGVKRKFLWEEVERARAYKEIDYCLGRSWSKPKCFRCGGCPTKEYVRDIVLAKQNRNYTLQQFKERIKESRDSRVPVSLHIDLGPSARGVPRKMAAVALARALMLAEPKLVPWYSGYLHSYFSTNEDPVWLEGEDVITLQWHKLHLVELIDAIRDPATMVRVNQYLGSWGTLTGIAPLDWKPNGLTFTSGYKFSGDDFFKRQGLKYTLKKDTLGTYNYEFNRDSLKKGYIKQLTRKDLGNGQTEVFVVPGPKFEFTSFISAAFILGSKHAWMQVHARAHGAPIVPDSKAQEELLLAQ